MIQTMQEEADAQASMQSKKTAVSPRRGKMKGRNKLLLIILSLIMIAVLRTGFLFVLIALLPSIVAYYMDITAEHYSFKTVFICNLSGVLPFIARILHHGPSNAMINSIMGSGMIWFTVYGAALVGLWLVYICPMVAQVMIGRFHNTQVNRLELLQKKIENEWGREVTQLDARNAARVSEE